MGDDILQQGTRIVLFALTGWLAKYGYTDGELLGYVGSAVTGLGGIAWWLFWNKKRSA